ncbi:MAG: DJ-1/PfpI family protein [Bacteroidota bacterium]
MDIVIYIYQGLTMLDAIGPYEVFRNIPDAKVKFVAKKRSEIAADSKAIFINAKYSIDQVKKADVLIIPGATIGFVREMHDKKVLEWIRQIDKTTQRTLSVCTGSMILAAAGLLKGRKATSHWKPLDMLKDHGAIPVKERFVEDGKYVTAAGVSAGIDMGLYVSSQLAGEDFAKAAQLAIEYDPAPPFDAGSPEKCDGAIIKKAVKKMTEDGMKDLGPMDLMKYGGTLMKLT